MRFPRQAGVLLHPISLPGGHGIGDLGPEAIEFLDFLADAQQTLWHVLPLGPTGPYCSPYAAYSVFAGNPLLISLSRLQHEGRLDRFAVEDASFVEGRISYEATQAFKFPLLERAALQFQRDAGVFERSAFDAYCQAEAHWLDDFALFMAAKREQEFSPWQDWPVALRDRHPAELQALAGRQQSYLFAAKYRQWIFSRQWQAIRDACQARAIRIVGDVPLYVATDSADVWSNRELWDLDQRGRPLHVAAAPPDFYHPTGRLWATPSFRWEASERTGFRWWSRRFRSAFNLFDVVRVNGFEGVLSSWSVPAGESSAIAGSWQEGPGARLFEVLEQRLGSLPLIAEARPTTEALSLLERFGYPPALCLQSAFGPGPSGEVVRPHAYTSGCVAYLGTQDTDTTLGWASRLEPELRSELLAYLGQPELPAGEIPLALVRLALSSVASTVILPVQDLIPLGSEARLNPPNQRSGHWSWRLRPKQLSGELAARLAAMTRLYDRVPTL